MAQFIGPFGFVSNFFDDGTTALYDLQAVATLQLGSRVFVYATGDAASNDSTGGVTVLELDPLTVTLSHVQTVLDGGSIRLTSPRALTAATVGGKQFIAVAAEDDNAISVFEVETSGANAGKLTFTDSVTDAALLLDVDELSVMDVDGNTVIVALSSNFNKLAFYALSSSGQLTIVESVSDSPSVPLSGLAGMESFEGPAGRNMLLTNSLSEGFGLWRLESNGTLNLLDKDTSYLSLGNSFNQGVVFRTGGHSYVYTHGIGRTEAQGYEIVGDELVPMIFDVKKGDKPALDENVGREGLRIINVEGEQFLLARVANSQLIFGVGNDGTLTLLQEIRNFEMTGALFGGVVSGAAIEVDGRGFLFMPGFGPSGPYGISAITIGADNDLRTGTKKADVMVFLGGDDVAEGGGGADRMFGGAGSDELLGEGGNDKLDGGDDGDILSGGDGDDQLNGGRGADELSGGTGVDGVLYTFSDSGVDVDLSDAGPQSGGEAAGDLLTSIENLAGSAHGDVLRGSRADNLIVGGDGDDFISGDIGDDLLNGGAGSDEVVGGNGNDDIVGENGHDILKGSSGNDKINGGSGDDICLGGAGDDWIAGSVGKDALNGGDGADTFDLRKEFANRDTIADFEVGFDRIEIDVSDFGAGLVVGNLDPDQFVVNTTGKAEDSDDRFIYNSATGKLVFDANGTGARGSAVIATFVGLLPDLSASDFILTI